MNTVLVSVNFIITILFPEFRVICMFYSISVLLLCMFLFFFMSCAEYIFSSIFSTRENW